MKYLMTAALATAAFVMIQAADSFFRTDLDGRKNHIELMPESNDSVKAENPMRNGEAPKRVAILHCVGSRDEKVGQNHCSKVCCITGIKQAIELTEAVPGVQVTNFYMDLRAFGNGYEELYRRSQIENGVTYVRGRISEAGETIDKRIQLKVEDTLVGRPLRMTVDMLVLLVGMRAPKCCSTFGLPTQANGFFAPRDPYTQTVASTTPGIYLAGTATGPKTIGETVNEAVAVARRIRMDLKK